MSGPDKEGRFDDLFLAIAQQAGRIEDLLDVFFSFLQRKTDFFHIMTTPEDSMGFPRQKAFEMLQACFLKHQVSYLTRAQPKLLPVAHHKPTPSAKNKKTEKLRKTAGEQASAPSTIGQILPCPLNQKDWNGSLVGDGSFLPHSLHSVSRHDCCSSSPCLSSAVPLDHQIGRFAGTPSVADASYADTSNNEDNNCNKNYNEGNNCNENNNCTEKSSRTHENNSSACTDTSTIKYNRISTWNGGKSDLYWWGQSLMDASLDIMLPTELQLKQDLKVDLETTRLTVTYKGNVILEGEFYEPVQLDSCFWGVEDRVRLVITLEKSRENWWGSIFKGEKAIDLTKVDSVKKIQEFDEETQSAIHKIIWEQQRKQQRLEATPEEAATEKLLRKAWNADGSPFKGQPFEVSKFNIQGGTGGLLPPDVLSQLQSPTSHH